jgi:predicted transposase/invertase (TIGR01784 family)
MSDESVNLPSQFNDRAYKKFLQNPVILADFLHSFIEPQWIEKLDIQRAEPLKSSFINPQYRQYENDVLIKIPLKASEESAYLYILLELQSSSETYMALRVANYTSLFYLDLLAQGYKEKRLPQVFPIVYYNGREHWTAPSELSELVQKVVDIPQKYGLQCGYYPISLRDMEVAQLERLTGSFSPIVKAELGQGELEGIIDEIKLIHQQNHQVGSMLGNWLLLKMQSKVNDSETEKLLDIYYNRTEELNTMFSDLLDRTQTKWMRQGREEGREEGIDIGEQTAVLALLKSKFGVLDDWEQEQAKRLVGEIGLEATISRILTAQSVAEVFGGES